MSSILRSQVARVATNSTPLGLQADALHTTLTHAVREIVETRQRRSNISTRATPEELSRRCGARPGDGVEVLRAALLNQEEVLTAEDELLLRLG